MLPYQVGVYGNPHSRTHAYGWESETAVDDARAQVAELIGKFWGLVIKRITNRFSVISRQSPSVVLGYYLAKPRATAMWVCSESGQRFLLLHSLTLRGL